MIVPEEIYAAFGRRGWFAQGGRVVAEMAPNADAFDLTLQLFDPEPFKTSIRFPNYKACASPDEIADEAIKLWSAARYKAANPGGVS